MRGELAENGSGGGRGSKQVQRRNVPSRAEKYRSGRAETDLAAGGAPVAGDRPCQSDSIKVVLDHNCTRSIGAGKVLVGGVLGAVGSSRACGRSTAGRGFCGRRVLGVGGGACLAALSGTAPSTARARRRRSKCQPESLSAEPTTSGYSPRPPHTFHRRHRSPAGECRAGGQRDAGRGPREPRSTGARSVFLQHHRVRAPEVDGRDLSKAQDLRVVRAGALGGRTTRSAAGGGYRPGCARTVSPRPVVRSLSIPVTRGAQALGRHGARTRPE